MGFNPIKFKLHFQYGKLAQPADSLNQNRPWRNYKRGKHGFPELTAIITVGDIHAEIEDSVLNSCWRG